MKNTTVKYLFILLVMVSGCTTSKMSKEDKSNERDYQLALKRLKSGKSIEKNKVLLMSSIDKILESQSIIKDSLLLSNELADKEKGYEVSDNLFNVISGANEFTGEKYKLELTNIEKENVKLKELLKNDYHEKGEKELVEAKKNQDKDLSREAYKSFMKSKKYGNDNIEHLIKESSEFSLITYLVTTETDENNLYGNIVDNQFDELENLELLFTNIIYDKKGKEPCDCKVEIVFSRLMVNDEETSNLENFQKEITETVRQSDGTNTTSSVIVKGSVTQKIKKRTLGWGININGNSGKKNCKLVTRAYTESLVSSSIRIRMNGDERAIPDKYKNIFEEPLLNRREMLEEVVSRVYLSLRDEFKRNY